MSILIGYVRGSMQDSNLELQRAALIGIGCQTVFEDRVNGVRAERPGLIQARQMLQEGDTLVVWRLDRLGRSVKQLLDLAADLQRQGVQFKSLADAIDTGTAPPGRSFYHFMARLAGMEHELIAERTRAGQAAPPAFGRKPKMTRCKIESAKKLLASGVTPKEVAETLGVSVPTLYRWLPASTWA